MEIVDHRVVTKRLNFCLHIEILVDFDLETAFHLLVVYFVFLAGQLFLLNLNDILELLCHIQLEAFVDVFFDLFHLLLHERL